MEDLQLSILNEQQLHSLMCWLLQQALEGLEVKVQQQLTQQEWEVGLLRALLRACS